MKTFDNDDLVTALTARPGQEQALVSSRERARAVHGPRIHGGHYSERGERLLAARQAQEEQRQQAIDHGRFLFGVATAVKPISDPTLRAIAGDEAVDAVGSLDTSVLTPAENSFLARFFEQEPRNSDDPDSDADDDQTTDDYLVEHPDADPATETHGGNE